MRWPLLYLVVFVLPLMFAAGVMPLCMRLAHRLDIVDRPGPRKIHRTPTPLLGGLAIVVALTLCVWGGLAIGPMLYDLRWIHAVLPEGAASHLMSIHGILPQISTVFAGGLSMALVGLADDIWDLSVRARLLGEFAIATCVVTMGIRPDLAFLPAPVVWVVAVVWVVGITNSFNLLDGADALAGGVAVISALTLALVMALGAQPMVATLLVALAGATTGFLFWNRPPARVFMGSTGSMFLGYNLAVIVLLATFMAEQTTTVFPILIPVLVLAIPLYDTFSVILIRLVQGKSIALADQNHLIHRLIRMGFSPRQGVWFIYLLTICLGFTSPLLVRANPLDSMVIFGQLLCIVLLLVTVEFVSVRRAKERERVWAMLREHGIDPESLSLEGLPRIIEAREAPVLEAPSPIVGSRSGSVVTRPRG